MLAFSNDFLFFLVFKIKLSFETYLVVVISSLSTCLMVKSKSSWTSSGSTLYDMSHSVIVLGRKGYFQVFRSCKLSRFRIAL